MTIKEQIPEDWKLIKLTEITDVITKGTTPTTNGFSYLDEGVNFVKVESIHANGKFIPSMFAHVGIDCHNSFKRSQLEENDILFTIAGALGRSAIVKKEILPANTNQAIAIIRLKQNEYRNYIFHYLRGSYINKLIDKINVSTAQANLSLGQINQFDIPLPPLPEQQKIAEILSTVDDKIDVIDQQISETQALKKGLMQRLLTKGIGHTEFKDSPLGELPESWEVLSMSDFTDEITDYVAAGSFESLRENVKVHDEPNYAIYVRLTDLRQGLGHSGQKYVDNDSYDFLSKSNLFGREILFANIGANVGEVWMMPKSKGLATIAPNMIVIRANNHKVFPEYLHSYLSSSIGLRQIDKIIAGSGHPKINKTELRQLKAILPPLPEQQRIASILSSVDEKIYVLLEKKTSFQELKRGLMQKLLTGKIRVNGLIKKTANA